MTDLGFYYRSKKGTGPVGGPNVQGFGPFVDHPDIVAEANTGSATGYPPDTSADLQHCTGFFWKTRNLKVACTMDVTHDFGTGSPTPTYTGNFSSSKTFNIDNDDVPASRASGNSTGWSGSEVFDGPEVGDTLTLTTTGFNHFGYDPDTELYFFEFYASYRARVDIDPPSGLYEVFNSFTNSTAFFGPFTGSLTGVDGYSSNFDIHANSDSGGEVDDVTITITVEDEWT